jgi:UDP-N-acetylglucosamine--N-acetylmuramyl-(pentapeptide) pyrophosphoryl-undecaprenol N-acetylglucosamine transferase
VVFVPYPYAAEDHQTVNAMQLVKKNAAIMLKDSEALQSLVATAIELLSDEVRQKELIKNISPLGITDADERIAAEIMKLI